MKFMKGWRTIAFNAAVLLVGVTDALADGQLIGFLVTPQRVGLVLATLALINKLLRLVTTTRAGTNS